MCPWCKLDWFACHGYGEDQIKEIQAATYEFYSQYNNHLSDKTTPKSIVPSNPCMLSSNNPPLVCYFSMFYCKPQIFVGQCPWTHVLHDYKAASMGTVPNPVSISTYLSSPPVTVAEIDQAGGLLTYWSHEMGQGSSLARMALDILTAPGACCTNSQLSTYQIGVMPGSFFS